MQKKEKTSFIDSAILTSWIRDRFFLFDTIAVGTIKPPCKLTNEINLTLNGHNYRIFPVKGLDAKNNIIDTDYCCIFDVNAIGKDSVIDLRVYSGRPSIFIGKDAWQVKFFSKALGVNRINVSAFL